MNYLKLFIYSILLFMLTSTIDVEDNLSSIVIVTGDYPQAINEADEDKGYIMLLQDDGTLLVDPKNTLIPLKISTLCQEMLSKK